MQGLYGKKPIVKKIKVWYNIQKQEVSFVYPDFGGENMAISNGELSDERTIEILAEGIRQLRSICTDCEFLLSQAEENEYSTSMEKTKMLIEVLKGEAGASSSNFLQEYKAKILPKTVSREEESKLILLTAADYLSKLVMEREPLSKEELQELPNKAWVWVEVIDDEAFTHPQQKTGWYRNVSAEMSDDIFACGYPGMTFGFEFKDMGTTWKASRKGPL